MRSLTGREGSFQSGEEGLAWLSDDPSFTQVTDIILSVARAHVRKGPETLSSRQHS